MRITKEQLKQIIKEELEAVISEQQPQGADGAEGRTLAKNMPEGDWNGEWTLANLTDANNEVYIVFPETPKMQRAWELYNSGNLSGERFLDIYSKYYGRGEELFGTEDEYQKAAADEVINDTYGE